MSLTVRNVRDILLNEFETALIKLDTIHKNDPNYDQVYNNYITAKKRWQRLFKIHGCMMSNIHFEASFKEFSENRKYHSIEECLATIPQ